MSEATVLALPGRRAARRSTSSSSSGAAAAAAGLSPWPSSLRYTGRGEGVRSTASPSTGTVSIDNGIRTLTPGSATAGSPMATSEAIRPGRAAAYHSANAPPSEWATTGAAARPSASNSPSIRPRVWSRTAPGR